MDLELKDKVVIVGGASKGLGRACAEVLAEEGAKVAICSRTQADLEQAAQEIRDATDTDVLTFAGDLDKLRDHSESDCDHSCPLWTSRYHGEQLRRPTTGQSL